MSNGILTFTLFSYVCGHERLITLTLTQKIKSLADAKKTTFAEIERKTGISNGQIRRWDSSSPKVENVQKVADYFNVSLDYLLGREEPKVQKETDLRKALENAVSFDGEELTENDKDALIAYMMGRKGK